MDLLLVLRKSLLWNADHVATLRRMGLRLHLVTQVAGAGADGRFASATVLPAGLDVPTTVDVLTERARAVGATAAVTFQETDIAVTGLVNQRLGRTWARPDADAVARDKLAQRELLEKAGIPSARHVAVSSVDEGPAAAAAIGYPVIVKPTRAAFSRGVELVRDDAALLAALGRAEAMSRSRDGNYFVGDETTFALVEEFLPGDEVTVDGVVVGGRFHLAGVTDKMRMDGPFFQEDYYTLPARDPSCEPYVTEVGQALADALDLRHCLVNVELRQDADGVHRVVEFSTRMSGGQNYRNLHEVHGLDLVRVHAKAVLTDDPRLAWEGEVPRLPARRTACIKYAYRSGLVLRNTPGDVHASPWFSDYIAVAPRGARIGQPPDDFDVAGSLALAGPYAGPADVDRIWDAATELDRRLDLVVVP